MSQLFVIGHQRSGTTSLRAWLSQSPDTYLADGNGKELQFFNSQFHLGLDWYQSKHPQYLERPDQILVDVNPNYSYIGFVAERIYDTYPDAKIVQVVRNPFERVYSLWRLFHNMRAGREPRSFDQFLFEDLQSFDSRRYLREGEYLPYVDPSLACPYTPFILESGAYSTTRKRYVDLFGVDNVVTVLFERMIKEPLLTTNLILDFAGGDPLREIDDSPRNVDDKWNKTTKRALVPVRHAWESWQLDQLYDLYRHEVNVLGADIGLDLWKYWEMR